MHQNEVLIILECAKQLMMFWCSVQLSIAPDIWLPYKFISGA